MSSSNSLTGEPSQKKLKTEKQSDLLNFFSSSPKKSIQASVNESIENQPPAENKKPQEPVKGGNEKDASETKPVAASTSGNGIPDPMIPQLVESPRNVSWIFYQDRVLVRKIKEEPRTKVAAIDLDQTLVIWRCAGWASKLHDYELWSTQIPQILRKFHDEGYKLVIFSNQGGIRGAWNGKKASTVKAVIDWIESKVERPIHAVMSTKSPSFAEKKGEESFHKPNPKFWQVAVDHCNKGVDFDVAESFFVGDSIESEDDPQGGVDMRFAKNVGASKGGSLPFHTPDSLFGPSDSEKRKKAVKIESPPAEALKARAALLGGYLQGPILLILCGVQGSGKSTFCSNLVTKEGGHWIHLSQDTIKDGKPGKREMVEKATLEALGKGHSVVVDRMHLDETQRGYFIEVAKSANVPAHVVFLNPPKDVVIKQVRDRTDHPGGVQGDQGVKIVLSALEKLVIPSYAEGTALISCTTTRTGATWLCDLYKQVGTTNAATRTVPSGFDLGDGTQIPCIALGTMGLGKTVTKDVVVTAEKTGFRAIDTAPTYKNEAQVGEGLSEMSNDIFCVVKVPKRAFKPEQVRAEVETSLKSLQRSEADLLLLHWPCDVIAKETLSSVWKEMEQLLADGKCKALGVCNFNPTALSMLLPHCTIRPVLNQVERHPLLPQMELVDFCASQDILLQAHTPLGQGNSEVLAHPVIEKVAKESSNSPAQVALQWNLQQGVAVAPKASSEDHQKEILSCKALSPEQMKALNDIEGVMRFVAPPFMFGSAPYAWGDRAPNSKA